VSVIQLCQQVFTVAIQRGDGAARQSSLQRFWFGEEEIAVARGFHACDGSSD